jgi:hypothetical protein
VVSKKESWKNSKKKLKKSVKVHSNMLGFSINLNPKEREESPLIFPSGNSKPKNITSLLLMLQVTEISSKI